VNSMSFMWKSWAQVQTWLFFFFESIRCSSFVFYLGLFWMNNWCFKTSYLYVICLVRFIIYPSKETNHYIHFNGCIRFTTFFKPLKNESHHVPLLLNQVLKLKFQINIGYLNSIQKLLLLLLYLRWFKYVHLKIKKIGGKKRIPHLIS
jgi:hypothetical protein